MAISNRGSGISGGNTGGRWPDGHEPFGRDDYDDGLPSPGPAFAPSASPMRDHGADLPPRSERAPRFEESGELALGEDDMRLPWLESDDEELEDGGYSTGQVAGLILFGLAAIVLIGAGIWYVLSDGPDTELVADGATIEAPETPYKVRPENPGGEKVAGTGDTSFAVAEGETRQVRIGDVPPPPPVVAPSAPASAVAASSAAPPAPQVSGVGVQVGAYSNRETAEKGWTTLSQRYAAILSGVPHRIVEGTADIGTVYRLQAVPGDGAAATRLCEALKAAGLSCQVKH